jgi:Mrp family chromosome partitioning ATPase
MDLMVFLQKYFDWVIVDTPPVMAVTDAAIVANLATGVLFVVGAEMTSRRVAQRAVEQLEMSQAKFLGAVLNRVDLEHNAYYYSRYYRPEYSGYYGPSSAGSTSWGGRHEAAEFDGNALAAKVGRAARSNDTNVGI